jgi:hypothetical protein
MGEPMSAPLVVMLVAAGVLPAATQADSNPAAPYRSIVARYRSGEAQDAVQQLMRMDRSMVGDLVARSHGRRLAA